MSTTTTPVSTSTRTPVTRNNGSGLVINVPNPGVQTLCVDDTDSVHIELHRNGERLTWYPARSLQPYGASLYITIPIDIVNAFDLTKNDELDVTVYPDRIEYRLDEANSLVINNRTSF